MKSDNPPINHHYVPQFLLEEWTVDGVLQRYQQPIPGKIEQHYKPTSATGSLRGLYSIPDVEPELAQAVEKSFMQICDSRGALVHKAMLSGSEAFSDPDYRYYWTIFLMSFLMRSPRNVAAYVEAYSAVYEGGDNGISPSNNINKFNVFSKKEDGPTRSRKIAMINFPRSIHNDDLGSYIINMYWNVLEVKCGSFLISDSPLIMSNGIRKFDGHIAMPISPKKLFLATNNIKIFNQFVAMGSKKLVARVNEQIVGWAKNFVAASDVSQTRFIKNRFGNIKEPTISELFAKTQKTEQ